MIYNSIALIQCVLVDSPDGVIADTATEVSPQSMTLTSLFDTFVPPLEFGDGVGTEGANVMNDERCMNDALFGFMNAVDGFPDIGDTDWDSGVGHNSISDA